MAIDDIWLPAGQELDLVAVPIRVYRHDPAASSPLERLANVECLAIEQRDGLDPGTAYFRYNFDTGDPAAPSNADEALDVDSLSPKAVHPGDRLAVTATNPNDGLEYPIFDGFVQSFALHLGHDTEEVPLVAHGVAIRCWDTPIGGALLRDAADPVGGDDVITDVPAVMNPRGVPNCVPEDDDALAANALGGKFPTFLDALVVRDPDVRTQWTLPKLARYLLFKENADEDFVANPDGAGLDDLLVAREPIDGTAFDPADDGTYTARPIQVNDLHLSDKDWPGVLKKAVGDAGFGVRFALGSAPDGAPETKLVVYHPQLSDPVDLFLQARGAKLDGTLTNLAEARIARQLDEAVNRWEVRGQAIRIEASFVLAPGFPSSSGDAAAAALAAYHTNALTAATYDAYRLFVLDETGEGHYAPASATKLTTPPTLDGLFGQGNYAQRRRKPIGHLFTVDADNKPRRWALAYSTDYAGPSPGLWDGTGTWQAIGHGATLLDDRLGIRVSAESPEEWHVGKKAGSHSPLVLKAVTAMAAPNTANPAFKLRLTCVVEADIAVAGVAERSDASALPWAVTRKIDARDRYANWVVAPKSEFNSDPTDAVIVRDDSEAAAAEAVSLRTATETGRLRGEVTIPYFTASLDIGTRIRGINGRGLGLRTDSGLPGSEPVYPLVVGRRFDFRGGQRTHLTLDDTGVLRHTVGRLTNRK